MQYKISYRFSTSQDFNKGALVTYKDEKLLEYINETLLSRTNFFYILESTDDDQCIITNSIDNIKTTTDQLIEVTAYVSTVNNIVNFRNIYPKDAMIGTSYILENQTLGVFLEESKFSDIYFTIEDIILTIGEELKKYKSARFLENKISEII